MTSLRYRSVALRLGILALLALPAPSRVLAQGELTAGQIEQLRRNPSLVREYIRQSGLTPSQIRTWLRAAGYPENLLDAHMPGAPTSEGTSLSVEEQSAIQALTLPFRMADQALPPDTGAVSRSPGQGSRVFGVDAFRRATTQFLPLLAGPVPPDYRLGPGDALVLILTGDVQEAYSLQVAREGFVLIPQVGQVHVANLTLEQLRDVLYTRLGRAYSGIRRGPGATTQFDVSVVNVRANQVYVAGEVTQAGTYQLSALGTALTALYAAGGVTERASLRAVEVRRRDSVVVTLDLYDYLLRGDSRGDIRLETGDVIFVPIHGARAAVAGAVLREAIYEITPGENVRDVLAAAGGFTPDADLRRITIHRILPPGERGPGPAARAAIDVELVPRADTATSGGIGRTPVDIPPLAVQDGDSLVVHRLPDLTAGYFVGIAGAVRRPGLFPWREGMTLRDLVFLGGGPGVGADLRRAEIARMPRERLAGQLADTLSVPLDSSYLNDRDAAGQFAGPPGVAFPAAGTAPEVTLEPFDQVLVLLQPEFELQRSVTIQGQVLSPGTYALTRRDERLSDLVRRAGGLRTSAYPDGGRFYRLFEHTGLGDGGRRPASNQLPIDLPRDRDQVNVSLAAALARPGSPADIVLQPGDSLHVPEYLPTVRVSGAVVAPSSVQFVEGRGALYYVENAGGFAENADEGRTVVRQANGSARTRSKFLFFTSWPQPGPGAEVFVPTKTPKLTGNWVPVLAAVASILASTASVVIAISTIGN